MTHLPLSDAQRRLWFLDRLNGTSAEYNLPLALHLRGPLLYEALEMAINTIVERHESLRTHFVVVADEPVQAIEAGLRIPLPMVDLSRLPEEDRPLRVVEALSQEREAPFDLQHGPVLRTKLLKLGENDHIFLKTVHHIASDGWSEGIFQHELKVLYDAHASGHENPLKPLAVQYADFALWQQNWFEGGGGKESLLYWKLQLKGIPKRLDLPADRVRPVAQTFGAEVCSTVLNGEQTAALKRLSQASRTTVHMTLVAAFAVLMSRYSGQDDIVIGMPSANRQDEQLEKLIGCFVNTLVMRIRVMPEMTFRALLANVRETALQAYRHQDFPFERLVEVLAPRRSLNTTPLFQVEFALQRVRETAPGLKDLAVEVMRGGPARVRFDLEVHASEAAEWIRFAWVYNRDLFDRWRVEQMSRHYVRVLEQVGACPDLSIWSIDLLEGEERRRVLEEWTRRGEAVGEATLRDRFEEQVEKRPDGVAVVYEEWQLSYGELNARAERLADELMREGVGPDDVVALALPRSMELVVGILGVLKAGGAYLPLDPEYPAERLAYMMEDGGAVCVVTSREVEGRVPGGWRMVSVEESGERKEGLGERERKERREKLKPEHAAYVIYTSGSTGRPKGVVVTQQNVVRLCGSTEGMFEIGEEDVWTMFHAYTFDFSVWEMWGALMYGGRLVVVPYLTSRTPMEFVKLVDRERVTVVNQTPSAFYQLMRAEEEEDLGEWTAAVRVVIFGGEALQMGKVKEWYERHQEGRPELVNMYGITETTVHVSYKVLEREEVRKNGGSVIGRCIGDLGAYVLDGRLEPAPVGVYGELYITGAGLARGYLKRGGLTAERFVAGPYGEEGKRMYRTGDMARWRRDGELEYLGRGDDQVKVRGFRIELGEIEAAMRGEEGVREAVAAMKGEGDERRLVGYVEAQVGASVDGKAVRMKMKEKLPEYMVPAAVMVLPAIPLTENRKVDRKALPDPEWSPTKEYRAPRTPEEEILCGLFAEVLGLEPVGLDDDFFAMGGHSLVATRLVSRIRAMLGVELALRTLFESPSVGELSGRLGGERKVQATLVRQKRPERLPLSYAQQRLWFLDRLEGTSTEYNIPLALRLKGELDRQALERAINTIVERHEALRTHFEEVDGEPVQVIERELRIVVPMDDLSGVDEHEQQLRVREAMRQQVEQPFDLARGPVLRVKLLKLAEREHVLLRTLHHIASDGWSEGIFSRECAVLYAAYAKGRNSPLRPLDVQYADFALWQRSLLEGEGLQEGLKYWRNQLAGIPERLELPTDRARPPVQTVQADFCCVTLAKENAAGLKQLSQANHATLYMTMLAAFASLLSRYAGQEDIVVGSPIANRKDERMETLMGFFVNTLAMRVKASPESTFRELLNKVRQTVLEAYHYQDVPFERLVEELAPQRQLNANPVFQVVFALQNAPREEDALESLAVEPLRRGESRVRFDLEVHASDHQGVIQIVWLYKRDLFEAWRIGQMARHYCRLLHEIVADSERVLGDIDLLAPDERRQVLEEWTEAGSPGREATLPELFEEQVSRTPEAVAVACDDHQITYRELNSRADRVAHFLCYRKIGPEDVVAIALPRSVEMMVGLIGVLKAGAAYLPLDPEYPTERLDLVLNDTKPACLLTAGELQYQSSAVCPTVILEDIDAAEVSGRDRNSDPNDSGASRPLSPQNPVYVIYTSGSTGVPKGVVITQNAVTRLFDATRQWFAFGPQDVWTLFHSYAFDFSVWEMWGALLYGGRLIIVPRTTSRSSAEFYGLIVREGVTVLNQTPSAFLSLMDADAGSNTERALAARYVIFGGEKLDLSRLREWYRHHPYGASHLINMYGITETTVHVTYFPLTEEFVRRDSASVIGRGIPDLRVYVLDPRLHPLPRGVTGELYVAGAGLARGYLKRPGMTADRFVADLHGPPGTRMYRTGDLARWRPDAQLEYQGRSDDQVKIRGFRIELGEVEATLRSHKYVRDAVVTLNGEGEERRLLAYVTRPFTEAERIHTSSSVLGDWQRLYEAKYSQADNSLPDFDIRGWDSSYTGEPVPREEMKIWVDETVFRLRSLKPRRVLEIGCGTGLLLTRLAPGCASYTGIDFSGIVVNQLRNYLESREDLRHVDLRHGMAHDLSFIPDDSLDLVILNSIVQYFPDTDYLLDVLKEAIRVVHHGGNVFVGDVRSLPLLAAYHTSVQLYKAAAHHTSDDLRARIWQSQRREEELVLAPKFFQELGSHWKKAGRVQIALKSGKYDNELSRFRYDVVITIGGSHELVPPRKWVDWDRSSRWPEEVARMLRFGDDAAVGVRGIPDKRGASAVKAVALLESNAVGSVAELRTAVAAEAPAEDPDRVTDLARRLGVEFCWSRFEGDGVYEGIFRPVWREKDKDPDIPWEHYRQYANSPIRRVADFELERLLRDYLREKLPEYMVPAYVTVLDAMPLTANGKVNRKALPVPELRSALDYRPPRTPEEEILCGLFVEVLGVELVGLDDDFFELGGHSLLATRLQSRIRAILGVELAIQTLFTSPTVGKLSLRLLDDCEPREPLIRMPRPEWLPLSFAQQRLWFLDRLQGGSAEYNMPYALRLKGTLNLSAMEKAIDTIVERHECLRTHFSEIGGEPVQVIAPVLRLGLPLEDLSCLDETARRRRVSEALQEEGRTPFDLSRGPVLRFRLLKLAETEHVLVRTMHHIVSDGWSEGVFNREFEVLYGVYLEGRDNPFKPLEVQYADFALWQRKWMQAGGLQNGLDYWKTQLQGVPDRLVLPTDRPRPAIQTFAAEVCHSNLAAEQTRALKRLSRANQTTLYMTMLAGFAVLLSRYSGQSGIVVGTPIANRQDALLEGMLGFFVNSLAMRLRVRPEMTFRELLAEARRTALDAYRHQDVPFERIVEELAPERTLNASPIFQVVFALQNAPWEEQRFHGMTAEPVRSGHSRVRFDLEVYATEKDNGIRIVWIYNRDLFDAWRIEQMTRHYNRVLDAITVAVDATVRQADLWNPQELSQVLADWSGRSRELPQTNLAALFEHRVDMTPDAVALVCEGESVTYSRLNDDANRLARIFIRRGAGPENVIALIMDKSIEAVRVLLAVLKAGAAYMPLASAQPSQRIRFMLQDARPLFVATVAAMTSLLPPDIDTILLDDEAVRDAQRRLPGGNPTDMERTLPVMGDSPSYVIYTSGSSGKPKAVIGTQAGLVNRLLWFAHEYPLECGEPVLARSALNFIDGSTELLGALLQGAAVVITAAEAARNPEELTTLIALNGIVQITVIPSLLSVLLENSNVEQLRPCRRWITSGEALLPACAARFRRRLPESLLLNLYGASEASGDSLGAPYDGANVSIGVPIWNTRVVVLDANLDVAPTGVVGELYIAGVGLARGYLQASNTAERFVCDLYGRPGTRMYRTGDLTRWLPDGRLEYLGRADHQVKIRGVRIEIGEIETVLTEQPEVENAVVMVQDDAERKRLVAYVTGRALDAESLRLRLQEQLPEYMMPAVIVVLERMPLTATGKVDRMALPEAEFASSDRHRAPRTPEEEILCGLFAEVLHVEQVGVNDNFFALGGHSLLAARLVSRIRTRLDVDVAIRTLFEAPSIAQLTGRLGRVRGAHPRIVKRERSGRLPLSYAQQRLWFLDRLKGSSTEYNMTHALRLKGELDRDALKRAINTIVERHESLRTHFAEAEGEPAQVIEPDLRIEVPVEDLSGLQRGAREERVIELVRQEAEEPFDLGRGPMLRVKLVKVGEEEHILLRTMHHIVSDAWSQGIFNREFAILYEAYREGLHDPLKSLPVQYADFALWQRTLLEGPASQEELIFWKGQLAGIPERLELPADRPRPARQTFEAGACHVNLTQKETATLKEFSQDHQATLYMSMLSALAVLLARYSGQQDIVVGSPIANRQDPQLEDMIGFFVDTLVMRVRVRPEMNFPMLLQEVRRTALEAYRHQNVPFEKLIEEISHQRQLNTSPIFQVVFALHNAPSEPQRLKDLAVEPVRDDRPRVRCDLEVHAWEREGALRINWLYNVDLFDRWRMEQMLRHYLRVLEKMSGLPGSGRSL